MNYVLLVCGINFVIVVGYKNRYTYYKTYRVKRRKINYKLFHSLLRFVVQPTERIN